MKAFVGGDDPFYLSKALTLKASLGVLSVDGNFEDSIAYLEFFVKFKLYTNSLAPKLSLGVRGKYSK